MFIYFFFWLRWQSVCLQHGRPGFDPWIRKIPWRRKWQSTPVLLPGKCHGQRSLVGYSQWDRKESYMTEQLHFHHSQLTISQHTISMGLSHTYTCIRSPQNSSPPWWAQYRYHVLYEYRTIAGSQTVSWCTGGFQIRYGTKSLPQGLSNKESTCNAGCHIALSRVPCALR